jgi:hypothetical protein
MEPPMVIYHTAPVRCFPLLVECMAGHFANPFHFRMPFAGRSREQHRMGMLSGIIPYGDNLAELPRRSLPGNGFPRDVLHNGIDFVEESRLRDVDFLYGIFDGRLIRKQEGDFIFTVISHPARHIYDIFRYLSYACSTTPREVQRAEGLIHFDAIVREGLPRFVDKFLGDELEIVVDGVAYDLVDDMFRFNFQVAYDFIGIEDRMELVVEVLSDRLGIPIVPTPRLLSRRSSIASTEDYRFADMCAVLSRELDLYERTASRICDPARA